MLEPLYWRLKRCDNAALQMGLALTCHGSDGTRKGRRMRATQLKPTLASYRDAVTELIRGGEPFGCVEDRIDDFAELTKDEKAALWLLAFSLRDRTEQQLAARSHLASLG
jgi:hypothetical protein